MLERGQVVLSLSGHDKDRLYVVVECREGFCYIADGKRRKLSDPKRKNPKHLRRAHGQIALDTVTSDKGLRRLLSQMGGASSSAREEDPICQKKMSSK